MLLCVRACACVCVPVLAITSHGLTENVPSVVAVAESFLESVKVATQTVAEAAAAGCGKAAMNADEAGC